jgi:HK97 family phage portal protein
MPTKIVKASRPVANKAWQVNPEPLVYASWVDFAKAMINSMLMRGEAFLAATAWAHDGYPARFVVLNPDLLHVEPEASGQVSYWLGKAGEGIKIDSEDLLHIKYQLWPGFHHGIGPLEASWRNIASAEAMSGYASNLSGRGGVPNAVLESDTTLTQEQAQALKGSWRTMIASNGVEPVILTKGLHYTPLSMTSRDLALIDHRTFDEQRIASAFGVPLWLVGLPMADGLTYSTVEGTWDFFWRSNLRALAHNIALAMSLWLLPADTYVMFDADELTRPRMLERAQAYAILVDKGIMLPAEVRIEEGWTPLTNQDQQPISKESLATKEEITEGKPG